jgi:hypothetical protein
VFTEFEFAWTLKDEQEFARARVAFRVGGKSTRYSAIVLGAGAGLFGLSILPQDGLSGLICIVIGTFLLVNGLGVWQGSSRAATASATANPTAYRIAISENGLTNTKITKQGMSSEIYPWKAFENIFTDAGGLLLAFYGKDDVWIPSTAFPSLGDRQSFVNEIIRLTQEGSRKRTPLLRALVSIARLFGR